MFRRERTQLHSWMNERSENILQWWIQKMMPLWAMTFQPKPRSNVWACHSGVRISLCFWGRSRTPGILQWANRKIRFFEASRPKHRFTRTKIHGVIRWKVGFLHTRMSRRVSIAALGGKAPAPAKVKCSCKRLKWTKVPVCFETNCWTSRIL